ncbi:MAG: CRISPR-associated protein Cas4 [Polyangiaceae bacterium]|nr:CRISPR-associated protein Cas4 [Polyangiaceae bacterium]
MNNADHLKNQLPTAAHSEVDHSKVDHSKIDHPNSDLPRANLPETDPSKTDLPTVHLPMIPVSDVRQWTFCQRVLWHRRVMPQRTPETPKMALGREAQSALEQLEKRRSGRRYGVHLADRKFDVYLESATLGVRGICDALLFLPPTHGETQRVIPVEVKRTHAGAGAHHIAQLAGYAVLAEEQYQMTPGSIDFGFIVLLPSQRVVRVVLREKARQAFFEAVAGIRTMMLHERFPEPTQYRSFCPDCEYVRFCGDVL